MSEKWDGKPRRRSDFDSFGKITNEVILARIDERVNTLIENGLNIKKEFSDHVKEDNSKFDEVNKTIWRTGGIMSGALAVIVFVLDWLFKR